MAIPNKAQDPTAAALSAIEEALSLSNLDDAAEANPAVEAEAKPAETPPKGPSTIDGPSAPISFRHSAPISAA